MLRSTHIKKINIHLQRCQPVASLRAEKPDTRNKFSTWRCIFSLLVCWTASSSGCNHYLRTATQWYFKCGEQIRFCPEIRRRHEVRAKFPTEGQHRFSIHSNGFWIICWTLEFGEKKIEANSSAHWQLKFVSSRFVSCFQQAGSISFSHTNARKRYCADIKKRSPVSQ